MNVWLAFLIGMFIGTFGGVFVLALCKVAGDSDNGTPAEDTYCRTCGYLMGGEKI